ncbi:exodeoxyribonuclease VII small subunit [Selenomonas sp.]|uniref:exodeoxyribonuclease VII small subunit n=1 Tax=Selenomonas sp. TaxID=2053611 RepID=UPI0025EF9893|nr:exodeoxyribonuclease VII small subunit [Selenomonas sp.]MCI6085350.1 exodeoxyribonuclease VII small subunit [Selenomonas sp.]MCI6284411.1 exodeoxyribonuclease VII small subunit [Selenomonas sp.]
MPRKKEPTFEEALARLQDIVTKMEQGDLPLQELITQYSEGMKLAAACSQSLGRAEQAMDLLVQNQDGEAVTSPLVIEEEH